MKQIVAYRGEICKFWLYILDFPQSLGKLNCDVGEDTWARTLREVCSAASCIHPRTATQTLRLFAHL